MTRAPRHPRCPDRAAYPLPDGSQGIDLYIKAEVFREMPQRRRVPTDLRGLVDVPEAPGRPPRCRSLARSS
jgi:hypothetical protein